MTLFGKAGLYTIIGMVSRFFLALHRRPHLFVIIQLLLLGILSLFIYQHWHVPLHPPYVLPLLLLLIWYVPLLFLLVALLQELLHKSRKSFLYSQLLRHHPDNCVKTSLSKEGHFR